MNYSDFMKQENIYNLIRVLVKLKQEGQIGSLTEIIHKLEPDVIGLSLMGLEDTIPQMEQELVRREEVTDGSTPPVVTDPPKDPSQEEVVVVPERMRVPIRERVPDLFFDKDETDGLIWGSKDLIDRLVEKFPDENSTEKVTLKLEHHQECGVFELNIRRGTRKDGSHPLVISFDEPYLIFGREGQFYSCSSVTKLRRLFLRKLTRNPQHNYKGLRITEVK